MSFLQRFKKDSTRDSLATKNISSFEDLSEDQLEAHLGVKRYGSFILTDAVRPSYNLEVVPSAGYRHDVYRDRETGVEIPVLMAAASREVIIDLFIDLLDPLGESVDVVLESSHDQTAGQHLDMGREHIDLPVLKSTLYDFEDILLDDGCTGLAVLNPRIPLEIQFDEHKLLIVYGQDLSVFEDTLADYGISRSDEIRFITEAEHVHSSSDEFVDRFQQLKYRMGIDD
ncbi:MAG: hypothetical protein HON53_02550 [Planctomycetaceae bacterium]|jgi:hypothetical protein|nr:hypothetical protein [Planctomycetaceae bacterium]MBT6155273.1 hypothetical protein [Planctomycetaceae bacterium]MBT6485231.1 hypothetical protein [Planctomycetaceae bacterium]MBT6497420.1 hypothetical protein [Planctomycetaceae bacterium]